MESEEEDYMSDKLIAECAKDDIRPGLFMSNAQKRKHEQFKKQQEESSKKPKSYHEQEEATREKGLSTALSSDNKGFQLLEKMGYKAGTGLGKSVRGIVEPVAVTLKKDAAGVGQEEHMKSVQKKKIDLKEKVIKAREKEFMLSNAERRSAVTLQRDFRKAQRICEELDLKAGKKTPDLAFFWSKQTKDALNKKDKSNETTSQSEEDEEKEKCDDKYDEEEEEMEEPKLCDIILYLRQTYSFCLYCGDFIYEPQCCPGYFRKDHDE